MARIWTMAACALLLLAAPARARDGNGGGRDRRWALGWEDGVTLRRVWDRWDVGLSAGPQDRLSESNNYSWDTTWPDSVQGQLTNTDDSHRESGFVRVTVARRLGTWENFALHATCSGAYGWSNYRTSSLHMFGNQTEPDRTSSEAHEDAWDAALGFRLSWRPVPYLGLQTRFGVLLHTMTGRQVYSRFDGSDGSSSGYNEPYRYTTFDDYGASGTGSIEFFVWF